MKSISRNRRVQGKIVAEVAAPHQSVRPNRAEQAPEPEAELGPQAELEPERQRLERQLAENTEALEKTRSELDTMAKRLFVAEEEERRRLARELHDDAIQRLAMLRIEAERLALASVPENVRVGLSRIKEQLDALATSLRDLCHRLHPTVLEHLGLSTTLHLLVDDSRRAGMHVTFSSRALSAETSQHVSTSLYRIAQEALHNVLKHAREAPVRVELKEEAGQITLIVEDRGPGFDREALKLKAGLGLISMQERVRSISGTMLLKSTPGEGTLLEVRVPIAAGEQGKR